MPVIAVAALGKWLGIVRDWGIALVLGCAFTLSALIEAAARWGTVSAAELHSDGRLILTSRKGTFEANVRDLVSLRLGRRTLLAVFTWHDGTIRMASTRVRLVESKDQGHSDGNRMYPSRDFVDLVRRIIGENPTLAIENAFTEKMLRHYGD
ncbi:hypothetical protein [Planotetraspora sp. GP83]|uniref:hypothetical protein n=1 Tax=Planotetraspora sp. GP83 TaxID=3156264 RepID=UPI003519B6AB